MFRHGNCIQSLAGFPARDCMKSPCFNGTSLRTQWFLFVSYFLSLFCFLFVALNGVTCFVRPFHINFSFTLPSLRTCLGITIGRLKQGLQKMRPRCIMQSEEWVSCWQILNVMDSVPDTNPIHVYFEKKKRNEFPKKYCLKGCNAYCITSSSLIFLNRKRIIFRPTSKCRYT